MPGSPAHLVRRFFDVARARPLTDVEREHVREWLSPQLADLFFDQPHHDQRHGHTAARSVIDSGFDDLGVVTAALMHDIGKRHARLGLFGRSVASVMIITRIRLPERIAVYRDHGIVGARELGDAGAPSLAIDFALHHHGQRPPTIASDVWDALVAADQPSKTSGRTGGRITSAVI
ncbi:MAG TPA: hypothetical protein VF115_02415 [Acidimicrobiia bacterium]